MTKTASTRSDLFEFSEEEKCALYDVQAKHDALLSPYATPNSAGVRQDMTHWQGEGAYLARPCFVVDVEKIIHNPFYSRCSDKTQVFSFIKNDDVTRRSFHMQVVSRVGRTIGMALNLNLDLIEAISVGHDLGHTPFGHQGEFILSDLYFDRTGRYFNHNVHSVRLLKTIASTNLCLQTYNGILAHNGEKAFLKYEPLACDTFEQLNTLIEDCYIDKKTIDTMRPSTLEGCVMRIADIIAYTGKDRQDAARVHMRDTDDYEQSPLLGIHNWEIIQNLTRNIIKNSLGKNYLSMDEEVFDALMAIRKENTEKIYLNDFILDRLSMIEPMMIKLYERFIKDLEQGNQDSPIFRHYLNQPMLRYSYEWELENRIDDIVVDYIASMTDDYFVDLFKYLYPDDKLNDMVEYTNYFN